MKNIDQNPDFVAVHLPQGVWLFAYGDPRRDQFATDNDTKLRPIKKAPVEIQNMMADLRERLQLVELEPAGELKGELWTYNRAPDYLVGQHPSGQIPR